MTIASRVRIGILAFIAAVAVVVLPAWVGWKYAYGDTAAAAEPDYATDATDGPYRGTVLVAQLDGSAVPETPAPTPADKLHDPISEPAATLDDVKQAKRQGWAVLAFAIGVIASRLLGRAKSIKWLAWLGKGRTAVVVGGFAAIVTAGYNAVAEGGSPFAGLMAGAIAFAAWWPSQAPAPVAKPEVS